MKGPRWNQAAAKKVVFNLQGKVVGAKLLSLDQNCFSGTATNSFYLFFIISKSTKDFVLEVVAVSGKRQVVN